MFFHHQDGAVALFARSDNRSAGHAALDGLSPAIDCIESHLLMIRLPDEASTDSDLHFFNGQTDIKGQE